MKVPFLDIGSQHALLRKEIAEVLSGVGRRGDFILGREVRRFEEEFAAYCGSRYAVGLNSGTDALFLSLKALGIGPGDEVIVPAFTFIATAFAVSFCGAVPVFCDINPDTFCIDAESARKALTRRTKAVIPVHLFGQCCDMDAVMGLARRRGLKVVEDACQSHGAQYLRRKKKAGAIGDSGCFSFYPTKNLGGWGDGGMAVTNDAGLYRKLLQLRDCGRRPGRRYEHAIAGYNSRLDSVQAAVLRLKLRHLDGWNRRRESAARRYTALLAGTGEVSCPVTAPGSTHVYHIYCLKAAGRDRLAAFLREKGIGTMINYPLPLHLQPAYAYLKYRRGDFPASERVCAEAISLPMHPFLTETRIRAVARAVKEFYTR